MDRKFITIYDKFLAAVRALDYSETIKILGAYTIETIPTKQIQQHVYMFGTVFECMRRCDNTPAKVVAKFMNQFELVLAASANREGFQQFLAALNVLAQPEIFNASILAKAVSADFNTKHWMRTVSGHLIMAGANATYSDDRKAIFLALTRSALVFFKLEMELNDGARYNETKHYLDCCVNLECLRSDKFAGDYVQCFKMMTNYAKAWENGASDWQTIMDEVSGFIATAPKTLRASAVKDIAVTLAEFVQISRRQLCSMLNGDRIRTLFKFLVKLGDILRHTQYEKVFCSHCKGNVGLHEMEAITSVAVEVYKSAIENNVILETETCEIFAELYVTNLKTLGKLECRSMAWTQSKHVQHLQQIIALCSTEEKMKYAMPMIAHVIQNITHIQLTEMKVSGNRQFDEIFVLRYLYEMIKKTENWTELIHVGYMLVAYRLSENAPKEMWQNVLYEVRQTQLRHKDTITVFETPYDYYIAKAKKNGSPFNLKFPPNVDEVDMMLAYLRINKAYYTKGLEEINNKCVYQLVMLTKKQQPIRCMRFIYYVDRFNWDAISVRCEHQLKVLRASVDANDDKNHRCAVRLLIGAFDLWTYSIRVAESTKKHAGLVLTEELNATDRRTIFDEHTLAFERAQAQLLLNAKKHLESFLEFYLGLNETDRLAYTDESNYLLTALRNIARNFWSRDYEIETLETFAALYRLAKVANDQFGMISACSYFAENSLLFREHFQRRHGFELSAMLNDCYVCLVQNIVNIEALSIRKQKEIFSCMLNIALYHFADNRIDDGKRIMQFVKMQMQERNINHGVIEMKYFSVLFTMITKYEQPSQFSAIEFGEYLMQKIRSNISNLSADDTMNIPLILFNAVPAIVTFCVNRYETSNALSDTLLLCLLKFSVQSGFVRRSLSTLILIAIYELYQEKWDTGEKRLASLEHMCQISKNSGTSMPTSTKLPIDSSVSTIDCTDPIRRDASISVHCLSPYKVIRNNIESHMCRYLLTSHTKKCSCDFCYDAYNGLILLQMGSIYTRITYLNGTDVHTKLMIQSEIYDHWSKYVRTSESSDTFLIGKMRMLVWCAHVQWKFRKNLQQAKTMLNESIELLRKVPKYDRAMEHDLLGQIDLLSDEIAGAADSTGSGRSSKVSTLNQNKNFIEEESPTEKQPIVAPKNVLRPIIHIDEIISENRPKPIKFQIHDDDSPDIDTVKKPKKKAAASRKADCTQKQIISKEMSNVVDLTSPPIKKEVSLPDAMTQQPAKKPEARPTRAKCVAPPNNDDEKLMQPTKTTRKRAEKIEIAETPVTREPRTRRERK